MFVVPRCAFRIHPRHVHSPTPRTDLQHSPDIHLFFKSAQTCPIAPAFGRAAHPAHGRAHHDMPLAKRDTMICQPAEPTTLGTSSRSPNVNLPSPRASPPTSSLPSPRAAARSREEDPALGGLPRSLPEGVPTRAFERSRRATPPVDSDRLSRQPSQAVGSSMVPEPSRQPTTTPEPVDGEEAASYTI